MFKKLLEQKNDFIKKLTTTNMLPKKLFAFQNTYLNHFTKKIYTQT